MQSTVSEGQDPEGVLIRLKQVLEAAEQASIVFLEERRKARQCALAADVANDFVEFGFGKASILRRRCDRVAVTCMSLAERCNRLLHLFDEALGLALRERGAAGERQGGDEGCEDSGSNSAQVHGSGGNAAP